MSYDPGKDRNFMACLKRVMDKAWWGIDVSARAQAPNILNGEYLLGVNAAGTGTVNLLGINARNQVVLPTVLDFSRLVPSTETTGSLISNDLRWSIAVGNLVNIVVASNVGTLTFNENHNLSVGAKLTIAGATVDTDLNATYSVVAASVGGDTKKLTITTSSVSDATYTDALIVVTAWQEFSTAGACAVKLLAANRSATGNFATLRVRARSDVATPTWNQNTIALDVAASANIADYGELVGLTSYAQDSGYAQTRGDHWSTAVKACMLCTGASAGSRFALVVSDYSTTKAATKHYLARFDKPSGACGIDGVFSMGNCDQFTYFAKFEVAGGYLTDSDPSKNSSAGALAVSTPAGAKWIKLFT